MHFGQSGGNQSVGNQEKDQQERGSGSSRPPQGGWTPPASNMWTPPAQAGLGAFKQNVTGGETPERHFVKAPVRKLWGGVSQREKDGNSSASPALGGWNSSSTANSNSGYSGNSSSHSSGVGYPSTPVSSKTAESKSVKDSNKKEEKSGSSL